jgi:tryptophan-rich sensory protein
MKKPPSPLAAALMLAALVVLTFCAPLAGLIAPPGAWYESLNKPTWNPPAWIFGPVWTLLYLMMAVAAWLAWKRAQSWRVLITYFIQLALNAAWTPVFFGLEQPGWALVVIIALWLAIVQTIRGFRPAGQATVWLLAPYLLWVSFATVLNFTLWRMNA